MAPIWYVTHIAQGLVPKKNNMPLAWRDVSGPPSADIVRFTNNIGIAGQPARRCAHELAASCHP